MVGSRSPPSTGWPANTMTSCPARLEHGQQNIGRVGRGAECDDDARAAMWGHAVDQVPEKGAVAYNDPRIAAHGL
jgi:hypothetical protein